MRNTPCTEHERQRSEIAAAVAAFEAKHGPVQTTPTGLSGGANNYDWRHNSATLFAKDASSPAAKQKRASRPAKARQPRQQMPQKEAAPTPDPAQAAHAGTSTGVSASDSTAKASRQRGKTKTARSRPGQGHAKAGNRRRAAPDNAARSGNADAEDPRNNRDIRPTEKKR